MRLISLELECRSFQTRQTVNFLDGMILINGYYQSSDTSSGVGKSTIPIAVAFALGIGSLPATDLKNWSTKKLYVGLKVKKGDDIIDIIRDPKLTLVINGVPCEGTSTAHEEKLQEILGCDKSIVKALTYRPQRNLGMFLSMTDSKQKDFLTKVLDLDEIENGLDQIGMELSRVSNDADIAKGRVDQLKSLQSVQVKPDTKNIESIESEISTLEAKLASASADSPEAQKARSDIQKYEQEKQKVYQMVSQKTQAESEMTQVKARALELKKELELLKNKMCWTCKREWDTPQTQEALKQKNQHIRELGQRYKSLQDVVRSVENVISTDSIAHFDEQIRNCYAIISSASSESKSTTERLSFLRAQLNQLKQADYNYQSLVKQIDEQTKLFDDLIVKQHVLSHSVAMLGKQGFLGTIFDEVLVEIQNQSNAILDGVPNVEDIRLSINSNTVTQSGKVNKTINVRAVKNGKEVKLKSLSGGQQASIELAVDLAVADTIKKRKGTSFGWIFLDEAMDGLDVNTKSQILEMVKQFCDGQIIVIDHSTEIKESFNQVIEVEYDGKQSTFIA